VPRACKRDTVLPAAVPRHLGARFLDWPILPRPSRPDGGESGRPGGGARGATRKKPAARTRRAAPPAA
jgi:hypothetical protein